MTEQPKPQIDIKNVTAQYRPDKVHNDGAVDIETYFWDQEQREELWKFTEDIYTNLALEAGEIFGVDMPEFQKDMISWVRFDPRVKQGAAADHDPNSGKIRMSASHVNKSLML